MRIVVVVRRSTANVMFPGRGPRVIDYEWFVNGRVIVHRWDSSRGRFVVPPRQFGDLFVDVPVD